MKARRKFYQKAFKLVFVSAYRERENRNYCKGNPCEIPTI